LPGSATSSDAVVSIALGLETPRCQDGGDLTCLKKLPKYKTVTAAKRNRLIHRKEA
jgi:hypothetical protein